MGCYHVNYLIIRVVNVMHLSVLSWRGGRQVIIGVLTRIFVSRVGQSGAFDI